MCNENVYDQVFLAAACDFVSDTQIEGSQRTYRITVL